MKGTKNCIQFFSKKNEMKLKFLAESDGTSRGRHASVQIDESGE